MYIGLVKKVSNLDSDKQKWVTQIECVDTKMFDTSMFTVPWDFNKLTKANFNMRITEIYKNIEKKLI